ncbi:BTB/POZ domain-containing protein isoform X1 [Cinnamomum micranthum f. kanehirae]|uniref:BTB/POZ domain-containing protein isoform X1 n=1 Tax=Cinnamomum micranthum f. kanehirae TaxID=337451 RepID=A0A443NBX6_9MAGN|nr:BTB/POZ domain-containing protein isoform X1 [Cinnamomum micranthum f. kanehirae]
MKGRFLNPELQKKQRVIIETIVGLLPIKSRKSFVPIAFLSGLLKTVTMVSASFTYRSDLERRIGLQLDQEDILIPANPYGHNQPLYETDSILRIFSIFLNLDEDEITNLRDENDMSILISRTLNAIVNAKLSIVRIYLKKLATMQLKMNDCGCKWQSRSCTSSKLGFKTP